MSPDDVDTALSELIELGHVEIVGVDESGDWVLRMTEVGRRYVEEELLTEEEPE